MSVATLVLRPTTVDSEPLSFAFDTFPTPEGYGSFQAMHEEEELTSPGVNGKRWRTVFDQFPPINISTDNPAWTAVASHVAACTLADQMRRARGRYGMLVIVSGGTRTLRVLVHVASVAPRAIPGPIIGPGISGSASVASAWLLEVLDDA